MHTPEEAKTLWCPMVRLNGENWSDARGARRDAYNNCIADRCAMWRWEKTTKSIPVVRGETRMYVTYEQRTMKTHGFCGLAGSMNVVV